MLLTVFSIIDLAGGIGFYAYGRYMHTELQKWIGIVLLALFVACACYMALKTVPALFLLSLVVCVGYIYITHYNDSTSVLIPLRIMLCVSCLVTLSNGVMKYASHSMRF